MATRLYKNSLYNIAGQGLVLLISFVSIRVALRKLGADALGIIYFTQALSVTLTSALDLGLGSTTVREVAALSAQGSRELTEFVRTASLFYWGGYGVLALSTYFVAPSLVAKWITLDSLPSVTAISAIRILAIGGLLALPRSLYASVMRGIERMEFNNTIDVGVAFVQQAGTVVLITVGSGLVTVAYYQSAVMVAGIAAYLIVSRFFVPSRALIPWAYSHVIARTYRYCSRAAIISLFGTMHSQVDKAITSKVLPVATFGYYTVAWSTVSRITLITGAVAQAAFPSLTALFKMGARENLWKRYWKLNDLLCYGMVPLFMIIPFAGKPLFGLLLGSSAASMLVVPTALLALGFYLNTSLTLPYVLSLAVDKPGISARQNIYAAGITLPLAILLIRSFGMTGAALSWVIYNVFGCVYALPRVCLECLHTSPWTWYRRMIRIGLLTALTYGTAGLILRLAAGAAIAELASAYAIATIAFAIGAYLFVGDDLRSDASSVGRRVGVWLQRRWQPQA